MATFNVQDSLRILMNSFGLFSTFLMCLSSSSLFVSFFLSWYFNFKSTYVLSLLLYLCNFVGLTLAAVSCSAVGYRFSWDGIWVLVDGQAGPCMGGAWCGAWVHISVHNPSALHDTAAHYLCFIYILSFF